MHGEASRWNSWNGCRNVHTKCNKGSIWDGNAVRVEFSVYYIVIKLISKFKFLLIYVLQLKNILQRHSKGGVERSLTEYGCCLWRPGCESSSWCFTVNQVNLNNFDADHIFIFLQYSDEIFYTDYNITLHYRQVCSNVFDGMIGDHADHNNEFLDDQSFCLS